MIVATHGVMQKGVSSAYCAEYQAILNFATARGYTLPILTQQAQQNQLLEALKSGGIWNKLDTLAIFAVQTTNSSSNFALIDWKRLTIDAIYTPNNAPTYSVNGGFTGNGSNIWINTNFNPSIGTNQYTLNDASRVFWADERLNNNAFEGTTANGTNQSRNQSSANLSFNSGTTLALNIINYNVDGWHCVNRINSNILSVFLGSTSTAQFGNLDSSSIANNTQIILRGGASYGNMRMRMYGMGSAFSAAQNTAFYNAIDTYLTAITI
jgi:hypothetical protein